MSVAFNGVVLVAPGVASYIDDSASSSSPTTTANAIAILGEAERGETGQPVVFTDSSTVRAYYGTSSVDLPLIYGITRAMNAGASRVYGLRVGNATKASVSITSGIRNIISLVAKEWGNTSNSWNLEVSTNSSDAMAKDIKLTLHDGRIYKQSKIGKNVAQIEYYSPIYSLGAGEIFLVTSGSYGGVTATVQAPLYDFRGFAVDGVAEGSVLSGGGAITDAGSFGAGRCVALSVVAPVGTSNSDRGHVYFQSSDATVAGAPRTGIIGGNAAFPVKAQTTTKKNLSGAYIWQPTAQIVAVNQVPTLVLKSPDSTKNDVYIPLQPYDTLAKLSARVNQYYSLSKAGSAAIPAVAASVNGASSATTFERLGVSEDSGSVQFGLTDRDGANRTTISVPYTKMETISDFISSVQTDLRAINNTGLVGAESLTLATVEYRQVSGVITGNLGPVASAATGTITATLTGQSVTGVTFAGSGFVSGDLATITSGSASAVVKFTSTSAATVQSSTTGWRTAAGATFTTTVSSGEIATATVTSGSAGSGYAVGDVLSVNGGTSGTLTVLTLSSTTNGRGPIATVSVTTAGSGYSAANNVATTLQTAFPGSTVSVPLLAVVPVKPSIVLNTASQAKFYSVVPSSDTFLALIGLGDASTNVGGSTISGVSFNTPVINFVAAKPAVSANGWKFGLAPGMADGTLSSSKLDMFPIPIPVFTTAALQDDPSLLKTYFSANTNALVEALNGSTFGALVEATKVYSSSRIDNGVYAFTGAIESPVEPSHWDEALAKLQQIEDLEIIVPMTSNASIQSATLAHCLSMSGPAGKRERFAVFGGPLGMSNSEVSALAAQFNDKRAVVVWPGVKDYNDQGDLITWAPYFAAATIAGQLAAQSDVATPLTNKPVSIRGLETIPRLTEIDELVTAGVLVIRYDSNRGYSVAQSLTTWSGDTRYVRREISTMRSADLVMRRVRGSIANIIGSKLTPTLITTIKNRITTQLEISENAQLIVGNAQFPAYKDILVRAVGDAVYAEFSISPAIPANYLLITAHIM